MKYNVSGIVEGHDFYVEGMSYIGEPKSNTAMFISKKVERLLSARSFNASVYRYGK